MKRRVVYVAIDSELHQRMAVKSIDSIKKHSLIHFDLELITVYTGQAPDESFRNRDMKTSLFTSVYDQTLFLDCDILAVNCIDSIWEYSGICIARNDRSLVSDCWHIGQGEKDYTLQAYGDLPHYNSGVVLFDNSSDSEKFFRGWNAAWQIYMAHDQLALSRGLADNKIAVNELPKKYNCYWANRNRETIFQHFSGDSKEEFFRQDV
jgi:alpha-N-acetylglucosamine transferase